MFLSDASRLVPSPEYFANPNFIAICRQPRLFEPRLFSLVECLDSRRMYDHQCERCRLHFVRRPADYRSFAVHTGCIA